ncbi:superoxide dismutase family protein [Devosia ginsengisoli]|uniref:superoxide dismutase family protein n=1 Tax=Devosia ginsengisoli TaxID=400770 RepID=UPI0026EE0F1E|nr:superoxide dismutase family protein [Devosia ginsengisoli]
MLCIQRPNPIKEHHLMKITTVLAPAAIFVLAMPTHAQDATASFIDSDGAQVGSVTLTRGDGGVTIEGHLMGISAGEHGFHFHATGDCDPGSAFESAGDHFNPTDHQHGLENPQGPHSGDLPNVTAAEDGTVAVDLTTDMISLTEGDPAYVFDADGTALVVHAGPDDMVTDPSGNSGDRIACAVIGAPAAL